MLASASCLNLQKTHTVPASVLLLSWKSSGKTRLADFICSLDIKNWLLCFFFFPWYFAITFQTSSVVRQVGVFSLHCLAGKCS